MTFCRVPTVEKGQLVPVQGAMSLPKLTPNFWMFFELCLIANAVDCTVRACVAQSSSNLHVAVQPFSRIRQQTWRRRRPARGARTSAKAPCMPVSARAESSLCDGCAGVCSRLARVDRPVRHGATHQSGRRRLGEQLGAPQPLPPQREPHALLCDAPQPLREPVHGTDR